MAPEHDIAASSAATPTSSSIPPLQPRICFFRAYEDGKPAQVKHFLRWSNEGPAEGDLVFVTGHPRTTEPTGDLRASRISARHPSALRPRALARPGAGAPALHQRGPSKRRWLPTDLHRVANARKALSGHTRGLLEPAILERKRRDEEQLCVRRMRAGAADLAGSLEQVAEAHRKLGDGFYVLLPPGARRPRLTRDLFTIARNLVRLSVEDPASRTPSGCASIATRTWNRCAASYSRRPQFTQSWNEPN